MRDWDRFLVRLFGVLHLLYGAVGSGFLLDSFYRVLRSNIYFGRFLYERPLYYLALTINTLFILMLLLAGLSLIRFLRRGVVLSNFVFSAEILYWIAFAWLSLGLSIHGNDTASSVGKSMGAVAGIGNMGTSLQLITGYPVIALIVLNLAKRRLDRRGGWNTSKLAAS